MVELEQRGPPQSARERPHALPVVGPEVVGVGAIDGFAGDFRLYRVKRVVRVYHELSSEGSNKPGSPRFWMMRVFSVMGPAVEGSSADPEMNRNDGDPDDSLVTIALQHVSVPQVRNHRTG